MPTRAGGAGDEQDGSEEEEDQGDDAGVDEDGEVEEFPLPGHGGDADDAG